MNQNINKRFGLSILCSLLSKIDKSELSIIRFVCLLGPIVLWIAVFLNLLNNYFFQIHQQNEEILRRLNEK